MVKNLRAKAQDTKDMGLIPGFGRSPGGGNGNPLQCSCLENPMHRGAWQAIVHRVTKSQTRLSIHECTLKSTDSPNNNNNTLLLLLLLPYTRFKTH